MERVLERFRRRLCLRVFRAEHALLLKKNASTMNIAHVSIGLYRDVWIAAIASSRKSLATETAAIDLSHTIAIID